MQARTGLLALWLAACGFRSEPANNDGVDAGGTPASLSCEDLACDLNATCETSPAVACRCKVGFEGDGLACNDVDECTKGTSGCPVACENTMGGFTCYAPQTCAKLKEQTPAAADGEYTLYLDGDAAKPWTAYCAGMADKPLEYLTLTGGNTGQYAAGGSAAGSDVTTTYSKVRFVPASKRVDIADRTFAVSTGSLKHPNPGGTDPTVTSMPYAVAMDCKFGGSSDGMARVDLRGTRFALAGKQEFAKGGGGPPGGTVDLSNNNQQATITGGGFCGWNGPNDLPLNPFNDKVTSGELLELVYQR